MNLKLVKHPSDALEASDGFCRILYKQFGDNCLLPMHAVFGLVKYDGLRAVDNFVGNFIAAVYGQAVHDQSVFTGMAH